MPRLPIPAIPPNPPRPKGEAAGSGGGAPGVEVLGEEVEVENEVEELLGGARSGDAEDAKGFRSLTSRGREQGRARARRQGRARRPPA